MTGFKLRMRDELERRYGELRRQSIQMANQALRIPDTRYQIPEYRWLTAPLMQPFNAGVATQIEKLIGTGQMPAQAGNFTTQSDSNAQPGNVID